MPRGRARLEAGLQPLLPRPAPGRTQRPELTAEGSAPPAALLCPQRPSACCWKVRFLAHSPHPQLNRQEGPRGAQGSPGTTLSRPTAEGLKQGAPPMRGAPATVFSIPQMGPGPALQTEEAELSHGVPAAARGEAGLLPRGVSSGHRLVAEPGCPQADKAAGHPADWMQDLEEQSQEHGHGRPPGRGGSGPKSSDLLPPAGPGVRHPHGSLRQSTTGRVCGGPLTSATLIEEPRPPHAQY